MKKIILFLTLFFILTGLPIINAQQVITFKPGPDLGKDASVRSLKPDFNEGDYQQLIAMVWTWDGDYGIRYFLIDFDLDTIANSSKLISARLNLYYHYLGVGASTEQTQYGENWSVIRRITSPWKEDGVTWNKRPQTTEEHQVLVSKTTDPRQDITGIDVIQLVQDMLNDPEGSFGFEFKILEEEIYRRMAFASSDHSDSTKWPELVLTLQCDALPAANFDYSIKDGMYRFADSSQNVTSWYWDFGDGYFSTVQNPVHAYFTTDTVEVCLTVTGECGTDTHCVVFKPSLMSVDQNVFSRNVKAYPNPADQWVTVNALDAGNNSFDVAVFNALGSVVKTVKSVDLSEGVKIDISGLPQGVYYVDVLSEDFSTVKKVVVQR